MSTLSDTSQSNIGWVYPPQPQTVITTIEEVRGIISGVAGLVNGQDYVDIVFSSAQPDVDWVLIEASIFNLVDSTPVNVWPGVVTNKTTGGFRLQLNGAPDSDSYFLSWSIRGVFGYYLTGPSSGKKSVASSPFTVRLPDSSSMTGTVIITPSDGGAGGTFTPSTVELSVGDPIATFTYTPSTYGVRSISTTNDRGLVNPPEIGYTSTAAAYTFSGPSSGDAGSPSTNFTVALPVGGSVLGIVVITPDDGGDGGTFTPTSVNLTTAAPSATFTYTPASAGSKTLSVTNNGGLTNPANLAYESVFSPAIISGLELWLKADSLSLNDGDAVATWSDSSGNGNHFTQSNASEKPTYKTAIVNGKPVIRFDGTDDKLLSTSGIIPTNTTQHTIFVVCKAASTSAGSHTLFASGTASTGYSVQVRRDAADWAHYHRLSGDILAGETGGVVANAWNQIEVDWDGTNIHLWRNTVLKATTSAAGMDLAGTDNSIGVYVQLIGAPLAYWNGDIAEILIYSVALSGGNRGLVEAYLATKYGL